MSDNPMLKFKAPLSIDIGYTNVKVADRADHTFEFFEHEGKNSGMVEWVVELPDGSEEEVAHIGLWWDDERIIQDYDGVFELPEQLLTFLQSLEFNVYEVS
jgi:hypothetical protein